MIKEYSVFRRYWDSLIFIMILASSVLIPLEIGFNISILGIPVAFLYIVDAIFILDIILNFLTTYKKRGIEITNLRSTAGQYARTLFIFDLLANIPIVYLSATNRNDLLFFVLVLRFFRIIRLFVIFRRWDTLLGTYTGYIRIFKFVFVIGIIIHWVSCGWFISAMIANFPQDSWVVRMGLEGRDAFSQYLHSIYWTIVTMTTVGYGDIVPVRDIEILFATITALLGASSYAFIIGNIASLLNNLDSAKTAYRNRMEALNQYFFQRNIPLPTIQKIRQYHEYRWARYRGLKEFDFLNDLPDNIRFEILEHLFSDLFRNTPFIKFTSPVLKKILILALKQETYPPGCLVMQEGEMGSEIIFIGKGQMKITSSHVELKQDILLPGEYFGDISIILEEKRTASVTTTEFSDVFILRKEEFLKIKQEYPEFTEVLKKVAAERSGKVSELVLDGVII